MSIWGSLQGKFKKLEAKYICIFKASANWLGFEEKFTGQNEIKEIFYLLEE